MQVFSPFGEEELRRQQEKDRILMEEENDQRRPGQSPNRER